MKSTENAASPAPQVSNDSASKADGRCHHRSPSGRRCSYPTKNPRSRLCPAHDAVEAQRHDGDRLHDLLLQTDNHLRTASDINHSLASLYVLLAEDRISARRAAVLAYISSLMLRTLPAIENEEAHDPSQIILDLPRPHPPAESEPDDPAPVAQALRPEAVLPVSLPEPVLRPPVPRPPIPRPNDSGPSSKITPAPNQPLPADYRSTVYRDPNYDDHWVPTAHILKTLDEIERQRFAPQIILDLPRPHPLAEPQPADPAPVAQALRPEDSCLSSVVAPTPGNVTPPIPGAPTPAPNQALPADHRYTVYKTPPK